MNICIIGSGMIGGTAARLFAQCGHSVAVSNRRGAESMAGLLSGIGKSGRSASIQEAADFGEVVLIAIPFGQYRTLPTAPLAGKIVIDAMNYYPQRDGKIDLGEPGSSELVARHLTGARVVKAFNTMYFQTLAREGHTDKPVEERLALFVAGDSSEAKAVVAGLIEAACFSSPARASTTIR